MTPGIRVKVTDQSGNLLSGVTVSMVGVTNNGAKVTVSPSSVVSANGYAVFGGPTINKTGGYALVASTTSPFAATITSGSSRSRRPAPRPGPGCEAGSGRRQQAPPASLAGAPLYSLGPTRIFSSLT